MQEERYYHCAVNYRDRYIYVFGGVEGFGCVNRIYKSTVERYDPEENCWSYVASMHQPRSNGLACVLSHKNLCDWRRNGAVWWSCQMRNSSLIPIPVPFADKCLIMTAVRMTLLSPKFVYNIKPTIFVLSADLLSRVTMDALLSLILAHIGLPGYGYLFTL